MFTFVSAEQRQLIGKEPQKSFITKREAFFALVLRLNAVAACQLLEHFQFLHTHIGHIVGTADADILERRR